MQSCWKADSRQLRKIHLLSLSPFLDLPVMKTSALKTCNLISELKSLTPSGIFPWHYREITPTQCPWDPQKMGNMSVTELIMKSCKFYQVFFRWVGCSSSSQEHPWWGKQCSLLSFVSQARLTIARKKVSGLSSGQTGCEKQTCVRFLGAPEAPLDLWSLNRWPMFYSDVSWFRVQLSLRINVHGLLYLDQAFRKRQWRKDGSADVSALHSE